MSDQSVRQALESLRKKHGHLDEEMVVQESKKKSSPLHSHFMWDDEAGAAHKHRLEIARRLIIRIKIEPEKAQEVNIRVGTRQYHGRLGGKYYDIRDVLSSEDLFRQHVENARRDALSYQKRYRDIEGLEPLFEEVVRVLDSISSPVEVK